MRSSLKSPAYGSLFNESVRHGERVQWDLETGRAA